MASAPIRGGNVNDAISSMGSGNSASSGSYDSYKNQLKIISENRKLAKLEEKNEEKAQKKRENLLKQQAKEADRQKYLTMAAAREASKITMEDTMESIRNLSKASKERNLEALETALASGDTIANKFKAGAKYAGAVVADAFMAGAQQLISAASKSVDENLSLYTKYMSQIDARIQGAYTNMNYQSLVDFISERTAGNPYITFEGVLDNLASLVQEGVASNLTQRAFLGTVSSKIATTFSVTDESLLRIIRIQRNDTTAARLGMEAELTKLFNYYFSDTSYLSKAFDSVSSALMDLSSQLGAVGGVETEYMVQKWLGSLGSSGVDEGTLTTIAQAINALGSGNIEYLTSNDAMQNLLVLSMNQAGMSYGDLLVNGINPSQVNDLLYNMVLFIRKTVSGTNNVVKAKYAELFGLSMADIVAIENLNASSITELYNQAMTINDMGMSLNSQLAELPNRIHFSEKVDNVIDNILTSTGINVANSPILYGMYKVASLVESVTGGIKIPTVSVMGTSITLPNSVEEYIKIGTIGTGLLSSLIDAIGNVASGSLLSLDRWGSDWGYSGESLKSYSGFTSRQQLSTSSSSTGFVSNSDTKGMQQSIVDEQSEQAESVRGEDSEEEPEVVILLRELKKFFENGGSSSSPLKVSLISNNSKNVMSNGQPLDLVTLVNEILSRILSMGTTSSPVVSELIGGSITTSSIGSGLVPGPSI